jgi:excinuclease ABC subunit A
VSQGTPAEVMADPNSLTGKYLSGKSMIVPPTSYRKGNGKSIDIYGAEEFNLQQVDVSIPLGKFVAITGVSGSGKSTLMTDILARALKQHFYNAKDLPGKHKDIKGFEHLDKVVDIDQSPIGRTPRSNPATYTGAFTFIRDLFAASEEARARGWKASRFSFNVKGGRCEACQGNGQIAVEMHFLPTVYVECDVCNGKRFMKETLDVKYKKKNIHEVLQMTIEEAMDFFIDIPAIYDRLKTLSDVGLSYLALGQSATTLSGGEAQRVKISSELYRTHTQKTIYFLDEPTIGLHYEDVRKLIDILQELVNRGNTVVVIEHNMDVIKCADHLIDIGPEGGVGGGQVVASGTPEHVARAKGSHTAKYLKKVLG